MTQVRMTKAEAEALGLYPNPAAASARAGPEAPRRTASRRTPPVPYHTVCHDCAEQFTSRASETRHLNATRHACYQLVLEFE